MAELLKIPTVCDDRGSLTVIEKILPFEIKRVYYIYNVKNEKIKRGGHRHKKLIQAAVCVSGRCEIYCNNNVSEKIFKLNRPDECLVLQPEDWHWMTKFSKNCVLLLLASNVYDKDDYINENY